MLLKKEKKKKKENEIYTVMNVQFHNYANSTTKCIHQLGNVRSAFRLIMLNH
jgi:hypothetical protein